MVTIRHERLHDVAAREALLDRCFGASRRAKTSERLREGRLPWLALVAVERGRIIGTVRLWQVSAGPDRPALLLGPLAVGACHRNRGIGSALVERAITAAQAGGEREMLLVGDAPYYGRFGFSAERTEKLAMAGPFEPSRLLSLAFAPAATEPAEAVGLITPTGAAPGPRRPPPPCARCRGRGGGRRCRARLDFRGQTTEDGGPAAVTCRRPVRPSMVWLSEDIQ
jgi:predicted N-acetyltransferase YhbS